MEPTERDLHKTSVLFLTRIRLGECIRVIAQGTKIERVRQSPEVVAGDRANLGAKV